MTSTPEDVAARFKDASTVALIKALNETAPDLITVIGAKAYPAGHLLTDAAQALTDQRATIERLERALTEIADGAPTVHPGSWSYGGMPMRSSDLISQAVKKCHFQLAEIARAALSPASAKTAEDRG